MIARVLGGAVDLFLFWAPSLDWAVLAQQLEGRETLGTEFLPRFVLIDNVDTSGSFPFGFTVEPDQE